MDEEGTVSEPQYQVLENTLVKCVRIKQNFGTLFNFGQRGYVESYLRKNF